MKIKFLRGGLLALALVCIDRLSKLYVGTLSASRDIFYTYSDSGWFLFSIRPELHDKYPLPADIVIFVLAVILTVFAALYLKYERSALLNGIPGSEAVKTSPYLTEAAAVLWLSGIFCSTFLDAFFSGGSLDFLCFEWAEIYTSSPEPYTVIHHFNLDLKDIFIILGTVILLLRSLIWQISLYRLPKESRKTVSKRSFHIIKSIREVQKNPDEFKNIADIFIMTALAVIFSAAFGYVLYILSVILIIPLAVEISPALDSALTEIGRKYDYDTIYNNIKSFCLFIGIIPGMCISCTGIKNRERRFIHDTGGMILTKDGLIYHLKRYFLYDAASTAAISAVCLILYVSELKSISPFTFSFDLLGLPLGIFSAALFTAASQLIGIIFAQNAWRAEYFYGE